MDNTLSVSRPEHAASANNAPSVSRRFADFIHATTFNDLPGNVIEQTKARVLDAIATSIEARLLAVPGTTLKWLAKNRGEATVIGHAYRVPAVDAAMINATLINGCTHDDFLAKSHAGAVTVPAAFAVSEEEGRSGQEFLTAIVVGYEMVARAYMGAPAMVPDFRATGVAGAIGAAATAGKLQALTVPELMNALGCATMFASGFGEGFISGTMDVKLNVGWACRSGVSAAMLARYGATAAPTAFEGVSGYFQAFSGTTAHAASAIQGLGGRLLMEDVIYKECPVCIFVQTPVHLARTLAQTRKLDPRKIRRVSVKAPEGSYNNPGYKNLPPYVNALQARISAPFCVAAALLGRPVHTYAYYDNFTDPEVLALIDKIDLVKPTADDDESVHLDVDYDGEKLESHGREMETLLPTSEKLVAKFKNLATEFLGARTQQVLDTVMSLDRVKNIRELTDLLRDK
jgi:2-methylcitrate dehydratase PrpD